MKVTRIGLELPAGELLLKYKSVMVFDIYYWEDEAATIPSDLTGSTTTLVVTLRDGSAGPTFTAVNSGNRAVWTLSAVDTDVTWDRATFQLKFTKAGSTDVLAVGPVVIQGLS